MWVNTALYCRFELFQRLDFAGDFEDSKSTSVKILCIFGSRPFVPISSMCTKQRQYPTVLQNRKSLRWILNYEWMDSLLSIYGMCWLKYYIQTTPNHQPRKQQKTLRAHIQTQIIGTPRRWSLVACGQGSHERTFFSRWVSACTFEKIMKRWSAMIIKGRSPTMRHVSRTHRVALDGCLPGLTWTPRSY